LDHEAAMSEGPAEKRHGFERWVASLKLGALRPSSAPPAAPGSEAEEEGTPLTLDEQATLINRIPKEVIYKLRERDSQRSMPKSDDSTAVFTPPPELLARAKRFEAPPKPERSSPVSSPAPVSLSQTPHAGLSAAEAAAFASLNAEEEPTTFFRPEISNVPPSVPPPALGLELSRPGDMQWIDGLPTERPPGPLPSAPPAGGSIAPAERRLRWVALLVALALLAGIYAVSRIQ
jgi:hypothetical protein